MPLRLSIHNSLLAAFLLMSLLLFVSITLTWRAFDEVEREQKDLIDSQIPKIATLGHAIDDGLVLLGLVSLLSRDISLDEYNAISSQALSLIEHMTQDLFSLQEVDQDFTGFAELLVDIQALELQMASLLSLRKSMIDNQAVFAIEQATLLQQIESAFLSVKLITSATAPVGQTQQESEDILFTVRRMEDIIRFLALIDTHSFLQQEKNQYRLLVNRLSFQMLAFSPEQRREISSSLALLLDSFVSERSLFDVVADRLTFENNLQARQEAISKLSIRLNEEYHDISQSANTTVEANALGLLKTISSSKSNLLLFYVMFLLLVLVFFYFFIRPKISERLYSLNQSTLAIANSDFSVDIETKGNDEISDMAQSLSFFRDELIQKEKNQLALASSEQSLTTIIQNVSEGLFTVSVNGEILSLNPACELIFGASADQLVGQVINKYLPEQAELFANHRKYRVEDDGQGVSICERLKTMANSFSGDGFTASLSVTLIRLEDKWLYSCFIRDITLEELSKKQLDELVQQLSTSNADLERFAYSCSHDLQEPIRMVVSFSDLLRERLKKNPTLDEEGEQYLEFIAKGAVNAKQLVADILEYSRLEQGSSDKQWVVVSEVVGQIQSMVHNLLEEKNASVEIKGGEIKLLVIPTQFKQLLMNLMVNGIKYNESQRPKITVSVVDEPAHWQVSVIDNGIGIAPEYQEKAFGLFTRLVSRRDYTGSGIGLSLCKKIVEKHHGDIQVTSAVGKGACFDVIFPKLDR